MLYGELLCGLESDYFVCRLNGSSNISMKRPEDTLALMHDISGSTTIVSRSRLGECIGPYRVLVTGTLDPNTIGVIAGISRVLALAGVPIMAYSSFERDYILVPADKLGKAVNALERDGFNIVDDCASLA